MAVYYPTTPKPIVGSSISHIKEALVTDNTAPTGNTRSKFTKTNKVFSLKYENITLNHFNILKNFFNTYQGVKFKYVHTDLSGSTEQWCVFAMDELKATQTTYGLRSTVVQLTTI